MGQAEEDVLKALSLCSQPNDTGTAFGKGTDQRGQCFIPQRGKLQRVRLVGQPCGRHPLLLQHGKSLGDCQHPQQRAAPAVLLQLLQGALEQQSAVVQDAHLIHHLLDLAQQMAGDQNGGAGGLRHRGNEAAHFLNPGRVQTVCGLVQNQQFGAAQ